MANGKKGNGKKTLTQILDGYQFPGCRLRRHQWQDPKIYGMKEAGQNYVVFRFTCASCKSERTDIYTRMGELANRYYRMANGYLIHYSEAMREAGERLTTREVARWMIRQMRQGELPTFDE